MHKNLALLSLHYLSFDDKSLKKNKINDNSSLNNKGLKIIIKIFIIKYTFCYDKLLFFCFDTIILFNKQCKENKGNFLSCNRFHVILFFVKLIK